MISRLESSPNSQVATISLNSHQNESLSSLRVSRKDYADILESAQNIAVEGNNPSSREYKNYFKRMLLGALACVGIAFVGLILIPLCIFAFPFVFGYYIAVSLPRHKSPVT